ncbi:MAG: maleylpyruvate isomerase family mycothiol-dependent enzyme [Actinomycetota bacterium]|nr:maleylpyruvate isomerase family mycothiol-dependent enzyme [Actinomycetota bacterium]
MTATCHQADHKWYCDRLGTEIEALAGTIASADWNAKVPTCPDWTMADLIEHLGGVHRWAGAMVAEIAQERLAREKINWKVPPPPELPEWIRSGGKELVANLRNADADAAMWSWGSDKHVRFWSRRQLHETAVHHADALFTLGREPSIDPAVAIDGIDEFLDNLKHAVYFRPNVKELRGDNEALRFRCEGATWLVSLVPEGFTWNHDEDAPAGATVHAAPSDLLLFFYGRREPGDPHITIDGDRGLLDRWVENSEL